MSNDPSDINLKGSELKKKVHETELIMKINRNTLFIYSSVDIVAGNVLKKARATAGMAARDTKEGSAAGARLPAYPMIATISN